MYSRWHQILLKHGKLGKKTNSGTDFFTTFYMYYFALKQLKNREFCKNTNVSRFKNGRKCFDAQNLPDVTVSKALSGQISPQNGVFTFADKSGQ